MSGGRTTWRAKPCGWRGRERVVALGEEFGPAGTAVLDLCEELAKEQRGERGEVRAGLRSIARDAFLPRGTAGQTLAREILEFGERVGAFDDLYIADDVDMTVTLRVSGFAEDQGRGYESVRKQQQRAGQRPDTEDTSTPCPDHRDNATACPETGDGVPVRPPTGQNRRGQKGDSPPTPRGGNAPDGARTPSLDESGEGLAEHVAGVLQRGVDSIPTDERCRPATPAAVLAVLDEHRPPRDVALAVAIETRSIVQSQNRAPNVVGLYAQKLAKAINGGAA
ncbi:hypothetical protein [Paraconexibacter algicola]|uniref:Uncharacterized protein n=1 Tax=Paraconexibacter algicola TaxID=2133960 RepID=A0A2T4UE57_9ACTN|nr:hypothetical protein [Paraconexibacter algicola]PTL55783.1 hypothetical protein C7Y72_19335 [Paraconexibacter algicola]